MTGRRFTLFLICAASAVACSAELSAGVSGETELLFVTNRSLTGNDDPARVFGGGRGPTRYGRCRVPRQDEGSSGRLELFLEFLLPIGGNAIDAVEILEPDSFWNGLSRSVAEQPSRPVILFVHGYSYGFARGCRRVSQFQAALGDRAQLILFSWPSDGNPLDYASDRADLDWSVPELAGLIHELSRRFGARRIKLAAHSMGANGVISALELLHVDEGRSSVAADLLLLAPDRDVEAFLADVPLLAGLIGRTTLYASENDSLLRLSARLNGKPRLGQGGEYLVVGEGFETIDVTPLGRYHPTGHEYHVFHPDVETDLLELLLEHRSAAERSRTVPRRTGEGDRYWVLRGAGKAGN